MKVALTRPVGAEIAACELTFLERSPIDPDRAAAQHAAYEQALESAGWRVHRVAVAPDHPDGVFVEDAVVALDEVIVLTRPGAASRRGEVESVEAALREVAPERAVRRIEAPGTLDGGDVLRTGHTLWVGAGHRTNADGIRQLATAVAPWGFRVRPVTFEGCLHLKTAVSPAAEDLLVLNPGWVDAAHFAGCEAVEVHPDEPFAANVLSLGDTVLVAAGAPRTRERLTRGLAPRRMTTLEVDLSELAKAEAGVTCCSVLL